MIVIDRSAESLLAVVREIDPLNNFGLQPHTRVGPDGERIGPLSLCNCAINALTAALKCAVPLELANAQHDWLIGPAGAAAGWKVVDSETARQRATTGFPTVATWKNPTGGHGHIMLVVPNAQDPAHLYVAGAGSKNANCTRIENSFGLSVHPDFVSHD